jgi:hypothetical protein
MLPWTIHSTDLESWRLYQQGKYIQSREALNKRLAGDVQPNKYMTLGKFFAGLVEAALLLEDARPQAVVRALRALRDGELGARNEDGQLWKKTIELGRHVVIPETDEEKAGMAFDIADLSRFVSELAREPNRQPEVALERKYELQAGTAILSGTADIWNNEKRVIGEIKTTLNGPRKTVTSYRDSMQWMSYLELFEAQAITFVLYRFRPLKKSNEIQYFQAMDRQTMTLTPADFSRKYLLGQLNSLVDYLNRTNDPAVNQRMLYSQPSTLTTL